MSGKGFVFSMLPILCALIISYLIGSIPTAYIFGRALKGIDIRKYGSGNVGATNALRLLGTTAGITVLALDIVKGILPILIVGDCARRWGVPVSDQLLRVLIGVAAICGHNWTVFLQFKGGKGIATTLGVLIGLALRIPGLGVILGLEMVTWIIVFTASKIVSLGSIIAAIALPLYMLMYKQSRLMIATSVVLCLFVLLRHKQNLIRLAQKKEPRLNLRKK